VIVSFVIGGEGRPSKKDCKNSSQHLSQQRSDRYRNQPNLISNHTVAYFSFTKMKNRQKIFTKRNSYLGNFTLTKNIFQPFL